MATQPEAAIVNAILRALNDLPQTYARKTHGNRYSVAWPDIVGSHHGQAIALEVKTATGKVTARQTHELAKWRRGGALVGVVRSVDEALAVIQYEPALTRDQVVPPDGARYMRAVVNSDAMGGAVSTHVEAKSEWDDPWVKVDDWPPTRTVRRKGTT